MGQRRGQADAHPQGIAHRTYEEIAIVVQKIIPLYSLSALRSDDQMIRNQRREQV